MHTNIGDVGAPHLIRPIDHQATQQIRIDAIILVLQDYSGGTRLGVDHLQSHQAHQTVHTLGVDRVALLVQKVGHPRYAIKRHARVLLIKQTHQLLVVSIVPVRVIVQDAEMQTQQRALPGDWNLAMITLY